MKNKTLISILVVVVYLSVWYCWNREELGFSVSDEKPKSEELPKSADLANPPEPEISFPVHGTIFLDPGIITDTDPTAFEKIRYKQQNWRTIYDWRLIDITTVKAFLFEARYDDDHQLEVIVNPEFDDTASARVVAEKYAIAFGRLPAGMRHDIKTLTINKGTELFGGGGWDVLIHAGQANIYEKDGILEEVLVHESAHTSLDKKYEKAQAWIKSQEADGRFISTYAQENPQREDLAESYLLYLAARHRSDRISPALRDSIFATIPNRIQFFDSLKLNIYPLEK